MTGSRQQQVKAGDTHSYAYTEVVQWTPETIRREREAKGWSQRELREAISSTGATVSLRSITAWERGESKPSGKNLAGLDRVLSPAEPRPGPSLASATDIELVGEFLRRLSERRRADMEPSRIDHDRSDPSAHTHLEDGPALTQPGERLASEG